MNTLRLWLIKLLAGNERAFKRTVRDEAMLAFVKQVAVEHTKSIVDQFINLEPDTLKLAISCNTKLPEITKARLIELLDERRVYDAYA